MSLPNWLYRSPRHMVGGMFFCCLVSMAMFETTPAERGRAWMLAAVAVLGLISMLYMFVLASRLRDAVQNERWPGEEIDRWRERVSSFWWFAGLLLPFAGMIALLVVHPIRRTAHRLSFSYWIFYLLLQCMTQVSMAFRRPPSSDSSSRPPWLDWRALGKLRSEHWGER